MRAVSGSAPFVFAILLWIFSGCNSGNPGDNSQPVTGKLTHQGAPLTIANPGPGVGWVELRFHPLDAEGKLSETHFQAGVLPEGTFNVPGPTGKGLPPGKYRVIVRQWDPYPTLDKLGGKYDETNSTITREVAGPTKIELDLAKLTP